MIRITRLPTAPSVDRPANFDAEASIFVAALPKLVIELNNLAGELETASSKNDATKAAVEKLKTDITKIVNDATALIGDFKTAVKTSSDNKIATDKNLAAVTTIKTAIDTIKTQVDAALNEARGIAKISIDDSVVSTSKTYSSSKIEALTKKAPALEGFYTANGGLVKPKDVGDYNGKLHMIASNKIQKTLPSSYLDCLLMNAYNGSYDVPFVTGIGVEKTDKAPRGYIMSSGSKTEEWSGVSQIVTDKNGIAFDSARLKGKVPEDFLHNVEKLPKGNLATKEFWQTVSNGLYYWYKEEDKVSSNAPSGYGLISVMSNNGKERNVLWFSQPNHDIYHWSSNASTEARWTKILMETDLRRIMPVGTIISIPVNTATPDGFLLCAGAAVSRTAYADLFKVISTYFGGGDKKTTFNLPDLRGKFIRGHGGNSAGFGVTQGDAIRDITGSLEAGGVGSVRNIAGAVQGTIIGGGAGYTHVSEYNGQVMHLKFAASNAVPTANENRPINMAMNFYIAY